MDEMSDLESRARIRNLVMEFLFPSRPSPRAREEAYPVYGDVPSVPEGLKKEAAGG